MEEGESNLTEETCMHVRKVILARNTPGTRFSEEQASIMHM